MPNVCCAQHGLQTSERDAALKEAGVNKTLKDRRWRGILDGGDRGGKQHDRNKELIRLAILADLERRITGNRFGGWVSQDHLSD